MHATFLIGEIGSWAEFHTGNILLLKKNRQSSFLVLKETWICFNHQLSHRRPVLCLNISIPPHITYIFKIDPPKSSLLENCTPLRNPRPPGRNKRSVPYGESNYHAGCTWKLWICRFLWLVYGRIRLNPRVLKRTVTNAVCTWRC